MDDSVRGDDIVLNHIGRSPNTSKASCGWKKSNLVLSNLHNTLFLYHLSTLIFWMFIRIIIFCFAFILIYFSSKNTYRCHKHLSTSGLFQLTRVSIGGNSHLQLLLLGKGWQPHSVSQSLTEVSSRNDVEHQNVCKIEKDMGAINFAAVGRNTC